MNCAKRSCSAQAACALPCAWPLPGLICVNGIMIRRIMWLMGPDLPLNFHPAAIRVSAVLRHQARAEQRAIGRAVRGCAAGRALR